MVFHFIFGIVSLMILFPSSALSYCSEPYKPYCSDSILEFRDDFDYRRCKQEVEDYIYQAKEYARCVTNEQQYNINEVVENFNRRVSRTNNR